MGKHKRERTEQIQRIGKHIIMAEQAQNAIEQHCFNKLVRQGVIVRDETKEKETPFLSRGAGSGKPPPRSAISTY